MNIRIRKAISFLYKKTILPVVKKYNSKVSSEIPVYEIGRMHLNNAKLLTNRMELLNLLPKNAIVAEIGVDQGDFSEMILNITQPEKLHLVDFWGSKRYNQEKRKSVENRFAQKINNSSVVINLGLSTQVVDNFADNYFDWIYIDTDHSYKTTISELELYQHKLKKDGIIAGHDFILGNWNGVVRYGVIEAVYEFCVKNNWEIIYLTIELTNNPSFAIRRIN